MDQFFTLLTLGSAGLLIGSVFYSVLRPARRVWPPPRRESWEFWGTWFLNGTGSGGVVVLALLHWGEGHRLWAFVPVILGLAVNFKGVRNLGVEASSGQKDALSTQGLYRYCRNPQYVGNIVYLAGMACLVPHGQVWIGATGMALYFASLPFAEEPWLRAQYGAAYESYRKRVPRFIPRIWPKFW